MFVNRIDRVVEKLQADRSGPLRDFRRHMKILLAILLFSSQALAQGAFYQFNAETGEFEASDNPYGALPNVAPAEQPETCPPQEVREVVVEVPGECQSEIPPELSPEQVVALLRFYLPEGYVIERTEMVYHPDGKPIIEHWTACGEYVEQINPFIVHGNGLTYRENHQLCESWVHGVALPLLNECLVPPPHECGTFADGGGVGRLWKPESDNDGRLVVLMPNFYHGQHAVVMTVTGDIVSSLTGPSTCCANGNRAHFRFNKPGAAMAGPVVLEVGEDCWTINNPGERID